MTSLIKHISLLSCLFVSLNAMDNFTEKSLPQRISILWDGNIYRSELWQDEIAQKIICEYDLKTKTKDNIILDVGCGTGHTTMSLGENAAVVIGIDTSPSMVTEAQRYTEEKTNIEIKQLGAQELSYNNYFDFATAFFVLQWIPDTEKEEALRCIFKALKPGGEFFATCNLDENNKSIEQALPFLIKTLPQLEQIFANRQDWNHLIGTYPSTYKTLKKLLEKIGFVDVTIDQKSFVKDFNEETLKQLYEPSVLTIPLSELLKEEEIKKLFNSYLTLLKHSFKNESGTYTHRPLCQLIIYATKPA